MNDKQHVYGYCPTCGAPGKFRERRPNGDDTCENGHKYKSSDAIEELDVTTFHDLVEQLKITTNEFDIALGYVRADGKRPLLAAWGSQLIRENRALLARIEWNNQTK